MTSAELRYLIAADELYDGVNGVKLIEIANKVGVSKVSVYRAVERLEKNYYIQRNEKNKVVLTEYGKKQLADYREIMDFIQSHLEKQCGTPSEVAYNDALGAACAFSDISRAKIAIILKSGKCLYQEEKEN
ncbi:MAG: hypothetical protein J6D11_03485 [Clostridia bacterium]|nr:hypothetical protein [Clostridia bacterium]